VTITGGATPGTFTGSADPGCALGFMGTGVWSVNYSIFEGAAQGTLSEVVLVYDPSNGGMSLSVGVGPLFDSANGFTEYEVVSNYAGHSDIGTGTVQLNDAGATATMHATGTTEDGVGLDVTVNCPSVTRG
jgi:hypothetical protein